MLKAFPTATLAAFVVLAGVGCSGSKPDKPPASAPVPAPLQTEAPFGASATLAVGHSVRYPDGLQIRLEKIDDSRCPAGSVCVWQGELAPVLRLDGGSVAIEHELRLGTVRAVEATAGSYAIVLREATTTTATIVVNVGSEADGCRRTGCSGEICSDQEIVSTCIYRPEFDCYKSATCERQADEKCGWTETPALTSCMAAARAEADP